MADRSNVFPVYIKAEFDGDDPFDAFTRHLERATTNAKQKFGSAFREIETSVTAALSKPLTKGGALDLDPGRLKAAADAAKVQALALREVAQAAERVAAADPSPAFRRTANEASNAAVVAERYSRSIAQQALAMDRLQAELDQTTTGTTRLASAQRGYTGSVQASRAATVQAGQQLQDIVISLGSGQRASTVFAQQLPQLAFAFSEVGGTVGRVARFFAGPWGIAVAAGSFALGPLIDRLFQTATAADEVKFATNAMGEAQGFLGSVLDLTTGKITTQSQALLGLAKAQLLVARVNAQTRAAEARRGVQDIQSRETQIGGGLGGGFSLTRRAIDARDTISQQVLAGTLDASTAVERLNNLRQIGKLTDDQFASAAASVANLGVELQNEKVFDEAEKLLAGTGGKSLLKPAKTKKTRERKGDGGAARLAEFGEDAASKIASISDRFGDAPSAVKSANEAFRQLNDVESDIRRRKPANIDKLLAQLQEARGLVESSLGKPFREMLETAREQESIDQRIINGRDVEAEILQRALSFRERNKRLSQSDAETIAEIVVQEKLRSLEIERQRELQQQQQALLDDTQDNLRQTVNELLKGKGFGAIGNLFERQFDTYVDGLTDQISEALFGGVFREQKLKLLGLDKVDQAGKEMAASVLGTVNELDRFKEGLSGAADALGAAAANDNPATTPATAPEILVPGRNMLTTRDLVKALGKEVFGEKLAGQIGGAVESAFRGAAYGQAGGGLVASLGVKSSRTGSQVGGALGEAAFKTLAPALFQKLGAFAGPLGSIAGGILGSVVGGLFKKTKQGSAIVTNLTDDPRFSGTGSLRGGVTGLGKNVQSGLASIIEQLGGTAGNFSTSIGQYNGKFRVSTSGSSKLGGYKGSESANQSKYGLYNFGEDEAAAVEFAILDAIKDGAVQGIREGAKRLLSAGTDLQKQVAKAVDFQSVFDRLAEIENPVGAGIDKLDREFGRLRDIFGEAGASAAEFAALERLYGLERVKVVEEAQERLSGSLKSLFSDLTAGNDARSLRERQKYALSEFDPLAARVAAGDTTAYDKFADVARQLLEIEQQIYGSQSGYFSRLDQVTSLTKSRIDAETNVASIATGRDPLFGSAGPNNDTAPIVGAISGQTSDLLAALNLGNQMAARQIELLERAGNDNGLRDFSLNSQNYF